MSRFKWKKKPQTGLVTECQQAREKKVINFLIANCYISQTPGNKERPQFWKCPFTKMCPARDGRMAGGQGEDGVTASLPRWHSLDSCVFPFGAGRQQTCTGFTSRPLWNSTKGSSKPPNAASLRCTELPKIKRESKKGRQNLCLSKDQTAHEANNTWQRTGSCQWETILKMPMTAFPGTQHTCLIGSYSNNCLGIDRYGTQ